MTPCPAPRLYPGPGHLVKHTMPQSIAIEPDVMERLEEHLDQEEPFMPKKEAASRAIEQWLDEQQGVNDE